MTLLLREHEESVPAGSGVSARKEKRRNEREENGIQRSGRTTGGFLERDKNRKKWQCHLSEQEFLNRGLIKTL